MTIPKLTPYTGQVANPDGSQTQTEFTQNMFDQLSYEAQLATDINATVDGMNSAVDEVSQNTDIAESSANAAEAAALSAGYKGLWPDTGGSALKGEIWQTQAGGTPTGDYYTALQNTSVAPVNDDENWRRVVTASQLDAVEAKNAQQDGRLTVNESDINALQAGQGSGVYGYATIADMNADLTPDDQSIAYVTNDATATNNGTYRKSGASGSGVWIQSSSDLASQAYQRTFTVEHSLGSMLCWQKIDTATDEMVRLTSLIRDVTVTYLNEAVPPESVVSPMLIRRDFSGVNELRFKYFANGSWFTLCSQTWDPSTENESGVTPFTIENVNVRVSGVIDWNEVSPGTSTFIYGDDIEGSPYQLNPERITPFYDVVSTRRETTGELFSFTPNVAGYLGYNPIGRLIIKTPYTATDNYHLTFDLVMSNCGDSSAGRTNCRVSFWARNNDTLDYYQPYYKVDRVGVTPKIQVAYDSDGYVCLIIGKDGESFANQFDGFNVGFLVDNVIVDAFGQAVFNPEKYDNWSYSIEETLPAGYTAITDALPDLEEEEVPIIEGMMGSGCKFVPNFSYSPPAGIQKLKVTLPQEYTIAKNGYYEAEISLSDIDAGNGKGIHKARVSFWGRDNGTIGSYGVVYKDAQFYHDVRVCLDADSRYSILIDGFFAYNSTLAITEFIVWNRNDIHVDGWKGELYADDTGFTQITTPRVIGEGSLGSASAVSAPAPSHKSFNIFGSSKSTTRDARQGWLKPLLNRAFGNSGYVENFTVSGGVSIRYFESRKMFSVDRVKQLNGVGNFGKLSIVGDGATIVQTIGLTDNYAEFDILVDGQLYGSYNNRNHTLSTGITESFVGNGSQRSFPLKVLDSHNFSVTVGGVSKSVSMSPELNDGSDCFAVRTVMPNGDGAALRVLYFPTPVADGEVIEVIYDTGRVIGFTQSDFNEESDGVEENVYPIYITDFNSVGIYKPFYPVLPVVTDRSANIELNFDSYGVHEIEIKITGGVNPYFILDFAVSDYSDFMNAAFGGYDLPRVLSESRWRDWRCTRFQPNPEVTFVEYGTNDDRYEVDRIKVSELSLSEAEVRKLRAKDIVYINYISPDNYSVGVCYDHAETITPFTVQSEAVKTSDVEVGDYIKIGEYRSSWHEFVVRKVVAVDKTTGTITWDTPITASSIMHYRDFESMIGIQFSVRRLGDFTANLQSFLDKLAITSPATEVVLVGMSNFNNNGYCSGWGYDEAMLTVASANKAKHVPIWKNQEEFDAGQLVDSTKIVVTNTGSSSYIVPHGSIPNLNRAMRVLVDGVDVTGKSAYVQRGDGWYIRDDVAAEEISVAYGSDWDQIALIADNVNGDVTIHFYDDVPSVGKVIELQVANRGWSDDGVHQTEQGNTVYANQLIKYV